MEVQSSFASCENRAEYAMYPPMSGLEAIRFGLTRLDSWENEIPFLLSKRLRVSFASPKIPEQLDQLSGIADILT